jgi:hypothetical protein
MSKAYYKALQRIMTDNSPAIPTKRSRGEIEANIAAISEELKKPLGNADRLGLIEDRHELRKQLAALTPESSHD